MMHPPLEITVTLYWSMEHYTTFPSKFSNQDTPSYNSDWAQRFTLSLYSTWTPALFYPSNIFRDNDNCVLSDPSLFPSDNMLSRMITGGMATILGSKSKPSQSLVQRHIHHNQRLRKNLLQKATHTLD